MNSSKQFYPRFYFAQSKPVDHKFQYKGSNLVLEHQRLKRFNSTLTTEKSYNFVQKHLILSFKNVRFLT